MIASSGRPGSSAVHRLFDSDDVSGEQGGSGVPGGLGAGLGAPLVQNGEGPLNGPGPHCPGDPSAAPVPVGGAVGGAVGGVVDNAADRCRAGVVL